MTKLMITRKSVRRVSLLGLLLAALFSCSTEDIESTVDEDGYQFGYGGQYASRNAAFESDWASQKKIVIVRDYKLENDRPKVTTDSVLLPWAEKEGAIQWLPQYTAANMVKYDAKDWRLVFNLTGIDQKPGQHFFGLYNRFTGTLRVFFYMDRDQVPNHTGNDHLWRMGFTKDLLEHVVFQFALPYGEKVTEEYKAALGGNDASFKTTPLTSNCSDDGKVTPAIGWWAYDIDMSPLRDHDFFANDRSVMTPGMEVYQMDKVVLSSLLKGSLEGTLTGNMNLKSLKGGGTSTAGVIGSLVGMFGGSLLNMKFLEEYNKSSSFGTAGCWGLVLGLVGKGMEGFLKKDPTDPDKLGDFNGKLNLSLNATIETQGTISGSRTSLVPSPNLNVSTFFKKETADGQPTCLGQGVWNIEHHPVVYVVTNCYYGDKPSFTCVDAVKDGNRTAYQLTKDPSLFGIRLISFMDPTAIGRVKVNSNIMPSQVTSKKVSVNYGVTLWGKDGHSDGFRNVIGLGYTNPQLSTKNTFDTRDEGGLAGGFRIIKLKHEDALFQEPITDNEKDYTAYRLSQQNISGNINRRMYGMSLYYTNKNAGPNDIDNVSAVLDPQVYLPADSEKRLVYDPDVPDYVVSATLDIRGKDEKGEDVVLFNTLRFVPKIVFIEVTRVREVYETIKAKAEKLKADNPGITFPLLDAELKKIEKIVNSL